MTKNLLIEGWRGINHSYAMVNQYQMLSLTKLGIDFFYNDLPFPSLNWNGQKNFCGFDEVAFNKITQIKKFEGQCRVDAIYRISFPYRLYPSSGERLFVFGTSEYQTVTNEMVFNDGLKIRYADRQLKIITPSSWSKVGFLNAGFREEQVAVVPHGVDTNIFRPLSVGLKDQYRAILGSNKDSFVLLSIGAMTNNKGIDILLGAYLELKPKYPQIKLVLKDQSNLYGFFAADLINHYCKQRGIDLSSEKMQEAAAGLLVISENLNLNQLNGLYNAADCYISPYRAEGFNLTPLEAAASGTPIIVTKGGSTDDYVHSSFASQIESKAVKEKNGSVYLEPSMESLIEKIKNQIEKKNNLLDRVAAYEHISNKFTWDIVTRKLINEMSVG